MSSLAHHFEEGGWGMYPTSVFGFFYVAAAVLYALGTMTLLLVDHDDNTPHHQVCI